MFKGIEKTPGISEETIVVSPALINDPQGFAKALDLVYVSDSQKGIERKKSGKGFRYFDSGKIVTDKDVLQRIKNLVLPPAWENVWICKRENGHLQATGLDARNRKQYKYHKLWNQHRNETKFHRMIEFGKSLPKIRKRVSADIRKKELSLEKIIATIISVMERTFIRIGNNEYEKQNGSYGLTTLKNRHVKIKGSTLRFIFKGKKGVQHDITVQSKRLARIVKQCRDIPGKELFEYIDENGQPQPIDSGKVNTYIKEITGGDFTAKDFRTWAGTLHALRSLNKLDPPNSTTEIKKNVVQTLDEVSRLLGNTRTVCKKYYVNPNLITMYENNKLGNYFNELVTIEKRNPRTGLTSAERVLIKILKCKV